MPVLRKHRADIYALLAYSILAIVLTYPLVLHLATHVTGDGSDDPALAWNLWWVSYSILNLGKSPIYTNYMFYPIGLNLAFYTLTYLNAVLSIPIQYAFNLVAATNLNLWLSFALSGFGSYLLVKYLITNYKLQITNSSIDLAAFAAGGLYAFSSNKFLYASLGQFNIASSHWIPFYILFLLKLTNIRVANFELRIANYEFRTVLRYSFLLGLFLLFQALSEFIFASFLIIFTVIYLIYWLVANRRQVAAGSLRLLTGLLVAVVVFAIPMLPILSAMISDMITEGDFIQRGLGFADVFSSDVLGLFVPSHLHPIFGADRLNLEAQFHFAYTNFAYLGLVALVLALIAIWKTPRARIWGFFAAIFISISLGPTLMVNGTRYDLPMPFDLLLEIPIIKGNRYPSRWSVMITLALAVLVGYGIAFASQKLKAQSPKLALLLPFAFLFLTLFEHLSAPLPLSNFQIPDVYQTIAQDKGDFTVLEIPLAWRNGFRMTGTLDQAMMFAQWYQTEQHHPILGGNTSRNPELKFQYFTEAPVINSIIAVETGHELSDATIQDDRAIAPDVLRFFGVRYVIWHSPRNPQNRSALDAARAYVQFVLPVTQISDVSDDTGETVVFRINDLSPVNETVILPNAIARLNFAEGWGALGGQSVWANRRDAKLFMRLDQPSDQTFSFSAFAPMQNQRVVISVNGRNTGVVSLANHWGDYSIQVPRDLWLAGMNEIDLHFDLLTSVASALQESKESFGESNPKSIVAYSAGNEVGDFAHIFVNGIDVAQNLRGYNIVVINEKSVAVELSEAFDTFNSADESARLVQFIDKIPNGRIVAVAVRDTAAGREDMSPNLTEAAVNALRSIGVTQDLRGKFRWSQAMIGVKGEPGSVCESANEIMPRQCVVGIGAMEPNVAAAFRTISLK